MSLVIALGIGIMGGWVLGIILITLLSILIYPFDHKNYTHPKWHTFFPYYFKIQYKEKLKNGQNLVYTTTPSLLEFPFLGDSKFELRREIFTKDYINSKEFKELKEITSSIMKHQKNLK